MLGSIYAHPLLFCFLLFAFPFVYWKISIFREKRAIARLGSFAPQHRNGLPLGIDIVIKGINHARSDTAIEFWDWLMGLIPNKHSQTVEFHIAGRRTIYTADPENIKAILATQFTDYGKGKPFHDVWQDFLGDSIFTTDGEAWHNSRQLIRPQFVKNRVADLEIFEKHVSKLMSKIGGRGQEVDVAKLFYRFTLDSATDYLLGKSVDSLDNPQAQFVSAFAELQRMQCRIDGAGLFGQLLPKKTFWASLKVLNEFVNPFIERALRLGINELNEKENNSFLHALAATGTRDRKYLRDQVVAVLLAGRDTTAATLSFTFQELAKQPEIVRKLRREILERVGKNKAPTYDDLKNMPYLQHCMNETLRLYPSVPFNIRTSLHDTTLPTGGGPDGLQPIGILKNTKIGYSPLYMQRRPDLYPPPSPECPDVLTYNPERWEKWTPKSWNYIPFNGGPRICIGQQFALTEMGYTITRILQRFERIDKYWQDSEQKIKAEITISPANGVKVGFWEAKEE